MSLNYMRVLRHEKRKKKHEKMCAPYDKASAGNKRRAVKINSFVLEAPMRRDMRWVPPAPGMIARAE